MHKRILNLLAVHGQNRATDSLAAFSLPFLVRYRFGVIILIHKVNRFQSNLIEQHLRCKDTNLRICFNFSIAPNLFRIELSRFGTFRVGQTFCSVFMGGAFANVLRLMPHSMPRPPRIHQEHYGHITEGLPDDVQRSGWILLAYCWLSTHIHELIQTLKPNVVREHAALVVGLRALVCKAEWAE